MLHTRVTLPILFWLAVQNVPAQTGPARDTLGQFSASLRTLTRRASPAVVEIAVSGYREPDDAVSGHVSQEHSNGSGVIVDPSGYIMTNAHVVQRATRLKVRIGESTDGTRKGAIDSPPARDFVAHVLGIDKESDLALLKIDATGLPVLDFGDSDAVSQGDVVLAIGSPMLLRNSLSIGVVSAAARAISEEDSVLYIQTDASINPGDSGGALIDTAGRLIGLNTSILSRSGGNEGIGFAVPANLVKTVYKQLRDTGTVSRGSLGIMVQNLTPALASALSLHAQSGILVTDIDPMGSGAAAGLEPNDVILTLDELHVQTSRQFKEAIYRRQGGVDIKLLVQRKGETLSLTAKVSSDPSPVDPLSPPEPIEQSLISRLGLVCIPIDKTIADSIPDLRKQYGLVVVARTSEGQARFLDLKPGDIIHELNQLPVSSLDAFRDRINEFRKGDAVALQIEREGHIRYTAFEIE